MAINCIIKEKIDKMKAIFRSVSKENQLENLLNKSSEERITLFKKSLSDEEARFLNAELEDAIYKDKLKTWLKSKLDPEYIEKKINQSQLSSIRGYIERNKQLKRITSIKRIDEVVAMKSEERIDFIDRLVKDKTKAKKINSEIEKIIEQKAERKALTIKEKAEAQFGSFFRFADKRFKNRQSFETFIKKNSDGYVNDELGISFSRQEMDTFNELGKNLNAKRVAFEKNPTIEGKRELGRAILDLSSYSEEITGVMTPIKSKNFMQRLGAIKSGDLSKFDRSLEYAKLMGEVGLDATTSVFRTLMATGELSALGIQATGKVFTKSYWRNVGKVLFKKMSTPEGFANLQADIIGDPLFKQAIDDKLTLTIFGRGINKQEDNFVSSIFDNIYNIGRGKWYQGLGVGRLIEKAERAHAGFLTALRFDEYQKMMRAASLAGEDLKLNGEIIARQINDFTGGSYVNPNLNKVLSKVFFSPRNALSSFKIFTDPRLYLASSKTARVQALKNMVGMLSVIGGFMGLSFLKDAATGEKTTEINPTGSKFGKIKVGNTYYDYTLGKGTFIKLMSKILLRYTKDSQTGVKYELGKNYGGFSEKTRARLILDFGRGKLAPHAATIVDMFDGFQNVIGEKMTIGKEAKEKLLPIYVNSVLDAMKDPAFEGQMKVLATTINAITGFFAFAPQYYQGDEKWENAESKEKKQFVNEFGIEETRKANALENDLKRKEYQRLVEDEEYKNLSNDDKIKKLKEVRKEIKQQVFDKYNFIPE